MALTLTTRLVRAAWYATVADSNDADQTAELAPLSAQVQFFPLMQANMPDVATVAGMAINPVALVPAVIDAKIVNGQLQQGGTNDVSLHTYVERPLRWRVSFSKVTYNGTPVVHGLASFSFDLPQGTEAFNLIGATALPA